MKGGKTKKARIGLKWRLFAYFSVFTGVLLLILWVCLTLMLDTVYRQIKTDSLKKCVNEISNVIYKDNFGEKIEDIARTYDVNVKIVDSNYETVYSYAISPTNVIDRISGTDIYMLCERAVDNGGSYVQFFQQYMLELHDEAHSKEHMEAKNDFEEEDKPDNSKTPQKNRRGFKRGEPPNFINPNTTLNLISTRIANLPDGSSCYIIVDSVITPVAATVRTLIVLLMYISIFTVIAAMLLAFFLARRISKPIVNMNKNAKRLAKGDYNIKFDSKGYAEIEQLNETMNYAANELSKADRIRNELIANVSHDLRTPLTMIVGYSEVMRDIPGENSPENVQVIIDEATRLTSLVNDLLDISKLQAGTAAVKKEEYNITSSVREIISRFDKLKEKEGYSISFEAEEEIYVDADESRISQVIYNLIINAINYTGEDKKVRVKLKRVNNSVRFEVTDSGSGIPKEDLPYIWDRYYRVDKAHKRAQMGTGLGLSIVKTVLEGHGAVYGVDSTLGVGSTFWFELPNALGK